MRLIWAFVASVLMGMGSLHADELARANAAYLEGQQSRNPAQQERLYNQALRYYLDLEGTFGSSKLYARIADCYYQLTQYGWAVLYYKRALNLAPRDAEIRQHLTLAQQKVGVNEPVGKFGLSFNERLMVAVVLLVALVGVLSAMIWLPPTRFIFLSSALLALATVAAILSLLYSSYVTPLQAVVVRSSPLYELPREDALKEREQALLEGRTLRVLGVEDQGQWLRVKSNTGQEGYLPYTVLRII